MISDYLGNTPVFFFFDLGMISDYLGNTPILNFFVRVTCIIRVTFSFNFFSFKWFHVKLFDIFVFWCILLLHDVLLIIHFFLNTSLLVELSKGSFSSILAETSKGGVIVLNEFLSGNGGKGGEGGGEFHFLVSWDLCFLFSPC